MKILRTTLATVAFIGAATAGIASTAMAQPDDGPPGKVNEGCPVVDENGGVTYVPIGTHIGPFYCGHDGDWHPYGPLPGRPGRVGTKGGAVTGVDVTSTAAAGRLARR